MIELDIPGRGEVRLEHLVLDYNGTLAADGRLLPRVLEALHSLASRLRIHVLTADTFGTAVAELAPAGVEISIVAAERQAAAKAAFVAQLGAERVVAIGNGRNDAAMLAAAALGIAVVQREGAAVAALTAADLVARDIEDALGLLERPRRLIATLRE